MNLGLSNKISLVTAASKGIGRAVADSLKAEGAKVVVAARDIESLKGETDFFDALSCDLSKRESVLSFISDFQKAHGTPSILVINTPGPPKGSLESLRWEDWQKGYESLYAATLELIQWVLPEMKKNQFGRIVLMTSLAAKEPIAIMPISSSLRAGLGNLAKLIAKDVASANITVNAVLPGWTLTPGVQKLNVAESLAPKLPQKRLLLPSEIGDVVAFVCSEKASGVTGQSLLVDGAAS